MAKGIVKDRPSTTSGKLMVVLPGYEELQAFEEITFKPDPAIPLDKNDAVQFRKSDEGDWVIVKKLEAPLGKVSGDVSNRGGTVKITEPFPNEFEVDADDELSFSWNSPPEPFPHDNDIIQVIIVGYRDAFLVKVVR